MNKSSVSSHINHWIKRGFGSFALLAFFVSTLSVTVIAFPKNKTGSVQIPQVRAKYLGFFGTTYSDWAVISIPETVGQPLTWKL